MFEIYFWILPLSYNSLIYIHGSWQNKMRLNINKKQVSIIQSTNINMNIYVTMLDGSNSCSWCSLKHWRRHSSKLVPRLSWTGLPPRLGNYFLVHLNISFRETGEIGKLELRSALQLNCCECSLKFTCLRYCQVKIASNK